MGLCVCVYSYSRCLTHSSITWVHADWRTLTDRLIFLEAMAMSLQYCVESSGCLSSSVFIIIIIVFWMIWLFILPAHASVSNIIFVCVNIAFLFWNSKCYGFQAQAHFLSPVYIWFLGQRKCGLWVFSILHQRFELFQTNDNACQAKEKHVFYQVEVVSEFVLLRIQSYMFFTWRMSERI